jgi:hypothetical protein
VGNINYKSTAHLKVGNIADFQVQLRGKRGNVEWLFLDTLSFLVFKLP